MCASVRKGYLITAVNKNESSIHCINSKRQEERNYKCCIYFYLYKGGNKGQAITLTLSNGTEYLAKVLHLA